MLGCWGSYNTKTDILYLVSLLKYPSLPLYQDQHTTSPYLHEHVKGQYIGNGGKVVDTYIHNMPERRHWHGSDTVARYPVHAGQGPAAMQKHGVQWYHREVSKKHTTSLFRDVSFGDLPG